jgi:hypothetical protein
VAFEVHRIRGCQTEVPRKPLNETEPEIAGRDICFSVACQALSGHGSALLSTVPKHLKIAIQSTLASGCASYPGYNPTGVSLIT